jgi:uncharacterized protein
VTVDQAQQFLLRLVHPERYGLVERMAADAVVDVATLISQPRLLEKIDLTRYLGDDVGLPTLRDILTELKKPGRDPRATFVTAGFRADVMTIGDLQEGMTLNGVVTNVAAFGAFVDIGVHQDGLVHVSQLADRFVKDPNDVVRVGQQVQVRVVAVDIQRKRISLTMRSGDVKAETAPEVRRTGQDQGHKKPLPKSSEALPQGTGALAAALKQSGFRVRR